MFQRIVHSDWSKHPQGRWCASARRTATGWRAAGPWPVGDVAAFVDRLVAFGQTGPTLAAFDFPIRLPEAYAETTGFLSFPEALAAFGGPGWEKWFEVARTLGEIGLKRPFYPFDKGAKLQDHLLRGLGMEDWNALMRACDRGGPDHLAAGCMFWTLGAKQVGKAAMHGWQDAIRPALAKGARLWPFDGALADLGFGGGLVLAESYPGDAYRQLGLKVVGKGQPAVLARLAPEILAWAEARRIELSADLRGEIEIGFARHKRRCGDAFDAVIGLLAAIAVADREHLEGAPDTPAVRSWEGWILGRRAPDGIPVPAGAFKAGGET